VLEQGFAGAWQKLERPDCTGCWCDSFIESNLVFALHRGTLLHVHRLLAKPATKSARSGFRR
jgi:hypothetical protein